MSVVADRRRRMRFAISTILLVAVAYLIIRITIAPGPGWVRFHATDFLAGFALPSVIALGFHRFPGADLLDTLRGKLLLTVAAVVVWEGVVPLLNAHSTADWRDVVAYLAGTVAQHLAQMAVLGGKRTVLA